MLKNNILKLAVLPGDGIGREVLEAALPIFTALKLPVTYQFGDIGWDCWIKEANPIPERTWELIKQSDATLLGATTSKPEFEAQAELLSTNKNITYVSPIIQLRQKLDLFANIRPCFSVKKGRAFNLCIIRENTEGLYSGFDFESLPPECIPILSKNPSWSKKLTDTISCSFRLQSKAGMQRIFQFAFDYAQTNHYKKVTFADKPNVLRKSSALARTLFEEIAVNFPQIQADIANVDAVGMHLVTKPEKFGVIVAENMFADILSDVGAGVMGGLGLAPSANVGENYCYFEPVHGSGLLMAKDSANPSAMFFSIAMLLSHFGFHQFANALKQAVINIIQHQKIITKDLAGNATTKAMALAIIDEAVKLSVNINLQK